MSDVTAVALLSLASARAALVSALGVAVLFCITASPALAAPAPPAFVPSACPKLALKLVPAIRTARCGDLIVPENRSVDTGRTIRLAVAPTKAPNR